MAQPRSQLAVRRELARLITLQRDRRKHRTSANYRMLVGAEWALEWALGIPNAGAVSGIVKTIGRRP